MARYVAKPDRWVSPNEESGTLQNASSGVIEISSEDVENSGIKLGSGQMISFSGTVYVRSVGNNSCAFTTVPFNAVGKGGEESKYELPTATSETKGGVKIGEGLSMQGEVLNVILESPTANITRVPGGASVTITDKNGTTSAMLYDGEQGQKGDSVELSVNESVQGQHSLTFTVGSSSNTIVVKDGETENWVSGKNYTVGRMVIYGSNLYQCITNNSDIVFNTEKWILIGSYPVYSVNESVIGTWIDKTLYQRTYITDTPSTVSNNFVKLFDLENGIEVIHIESTCKNVIKGVSDISSVVDISPVKVIVAENQVFCKIYGEQQAGVKIYITIKYIKNS